MATIAFEPTTGTDGETAWKRCLDPPWVCPLGDVDYLFPGDDNKGYVNGFPVIGDRHPVRPGDLVGLRDRDGRLVTRFLYAGRVAATVEASGQPSAFLGTPLHGDAVSCPCSALFSQDEAAQLGSCPGCGASLSGDTAAIREPGEEIQ